MKPEPILYTPAYEDPPLWIRHIHLIFEGLLAGVIVALLRFG